MKKLTLTIAIFLGLSLATFADGGGLFNRGYNAKNGSSGYIYFGADDMVNREGEAFAEPTSLASVANNDKPRVKFLFILFCEAGGARRRRLFLKNNYLCSFNNTPCS